MSDGRLTLVRAGERDSSGVQTEGMQRAAGIADSTCDAKNLWMGYVTVLPGAVSDAHHHGDNESGIFIISGNARFHFGERLDEVLDANPGDFVHVPPHVVHVEANRSDSEPVLMIVARDSQEGVTVNLDLQQDDFKRRMWR